MKFAFKDWLSARLPRLETADEVTAAPPETNPGAINFRRLTRLMPFFLVIFCLMFALSLYIDEQRELQIALGAMVAVISTSQLMAIGIRPLQDIDPAKRQSQNRQSLLVDFFALSLLLWGATMVGYQPNAIIPYFDFLIAVIFIGVFMLLPGIKILAMYLVTLLYLVFLTPVLKLSTTNHLLLGVSLAITLASAFLLSRAYYYQILRSINLASLLYEQQQSLSSKVEEKSAALIAAQDNMSREVIRILAKVLDDYDSYTRGHSENVARLAEMIARRMGFAADFQKQMFWIGMIHDVGKIRVPKHILNKPGKLSADEFDKIKMHPVYGYDMIRESEVLRPLAEIVLCHHEHYDGTGHPNHYRGDQIPAAAQILSIADAWDAMLSRRIYRDALTLEHAKSELIRCSGKQFSPHLVNAFIQMVEEDPASVERAVDPKNQAILSNYKEGKR